MRFSRAVDIFIRDMQSQGRINSPRTERDYRGTLGVHAEVVSNRDPVTTNREDVKRTLSRWKHPNSQAKNHAILRSFYDWAMEEGYRKDNPARQVRRAKRRKPRKYRLTEEETSALLSAAKGTRERRLVYIGVCAGLRAETLRGLRGIHFRRLPGFIWVSEDIAKGSREHWMPVLPDLREVVKEILENVKDDEYVLPAQRFRDPGINKQLTDYELHPSSPQSIWRLVRKVGRNAGITEPISPHTMRHAFADHIAKSLGVWMAKALLNHADLSTTEAYLSDPTKDELNTAIQGLIRARPSERLFSPTDPATANVDAVRHQIEPVQDATRSVERILQGLFDSSALREAARAV